MFNFQTKRREQKDHVCSISYQSTHVQTLRLTLTTGMVYKPSCNWYLIRWTHGKSICFPAPYLRAGQPSVPLHNTIITSHYVLSILHLAFKLLNTYIFNLSISMFVQSCSIINRSLFIVCCSNDVILTLISYFDTPYTYLTRLLAINAGTVASL